MLESRPDNRKARGEGRVILLLALLMFGGALFMLGKVWYAKQTGPNETLSTESGLTDVHFISTENILDRIKRGDDMHVMDIRQRDSFEAQHLIDSEWLGLSEIPYYSAPEGKLIIVVYGDENSNDQLREVSARYSAKKINFRFLQDGIRGWINNGGSVIQKSNPNSYVDQTKVITIAPEEVEALRQSLVRSAVLDVRSEREYAAGHIPGALHIPLFRLEKDRATLPAAASLFVYGSNDEDTFQAGTQLFDMGFFGLRVIMGGFEAWKAKGLSIEVSQ